MIKHPPTGVLVPLVTPLTADRQLDEAALERLASFFVAHGTGFFLLGTTAEGALLTSAMKRTIVRCVAAIARDAVPVYAGVSSSCVADSIEQAELYAQLGAHGVFAHPPSSYPLTETEIEAYFTAIADHAPVPLVLYNIPLTTRLSIPIELAERLSRHDNVVGLKDSERDAERLERSLSLWTERSDFFFLVGWAARSAHGALKGANGLVPGSANLSPDLYWSLFRAARAGATDEANAAQRLTDELSACYQQGRTLTESLAALKYLMHLRGFCEPHMMPPIQSLAETERERVRRTFEALEIKEA